MNPLREHLITRRRGLLLLVTSGAFLACRPKQGSAPIGGPEITAVLELAPDEFEDPHPRVHEISGDGHTHTVTIDARSLASVAAGERLIVQSGPGGPDQHTHWVQVRRRA